MPSRKIDARYFPLILDSVSQGIFTVDAAGRIMTFNRAAERITGFWEADVVGRLCKDVFQTDLCDSVCPMQQSIGEREEVRDKEVWIHKSDGSSIPLSVTTTPLQTRTGKLLGGVEVFHDLSQIKALKRRLEGSYRFEDIVSKNREMQRIFRLLPLVADSNSTVLVTGESGTGKELVARAIHSSGPRSKAPFVAVNCAAMPETLLESELFGYRKGAFTDAKTDRPGRIAKAEKGTILFDEVADLSKPLQVKLLRFLQERQYEPLGSTRSVQADVRVIASTNRDLNAMVREGSFREDLYFRLNVMEIHLPPLRHRAEDIPLLVEHFIDRFQVETGRPIVGIDEDALALIVRYPFPGNIRELENIIERSFILCTGEKIVVDCLPNYMIEVQEDHPSASGPPLGSLKMTERDLLLETLERHNGNRTRAAEELGIHRVTLVRKLKKLGLV